MATIESLQADYNDFGLGGRVGPFGSHMRLGGVKSTEYVEESPEELAQAAGVELETYTLARLIASEGYGRSKYSSNPAFGDRDKRKGFAAAAVAICQTGVNDSQRAFWSKGKTDPITLWLTRSANGAPRHGRYGRQRGRRAASISTPREWHVRVARSVLAGELTDHTDGAVQFLDPRASDGGTQAGDAIDGTLVVATRWRTAWIGNVIPTVDPYFLALFKPASQSTKGEAFAALAAMVRDGRNRMTRDRFGVSSPLSGSPDRFPPFGPTEGAGFMGTFWSLLKALLL